VKRFVGLAWWLIGVVSCGGSAPAETGPAPAAPLPTAGLAGQQVAVFPLTLLVTDDALPWRDAVGVRRAALARADSLLLEALQERAPEVTWISPEQLRRAARRGAGTFADPDQMATALLRSPSLRRLPEPLWSQMRQLAAVAGDRYVMVPAALVFVPGTADLGRAELTVALADVRSGEIGWRTVANAEASEPWDALRRAIHTLTPGLP
jgi:hypothetical protein